MPGIFEALKKYEPYVKKHMVTIQGKKIQVSLDKKLEILKAGEEKYMLQGDNIILKPVSKTQRRFPVIKKLEQDPYWIVSDEGLIWQIESE